MTYDAALEKTVDKILKQSENKLLENLKKSLDDSKKTLTDSLSSLEQEYEGIIAEGKKEADKIQKQIVGSSALEARNKEIMLIEKSIGEVFDSAVEKLRELKRNKDYTKHLTQLIDEAIKSIGMSDVIITTNSKDKNIVKGIIKKYDGVTLSRDTIDCIGGVRVSSKDGSMNFDNTIDARLERLKPVLRKNAATKFGL
ncbi:MAG: V-type ATP synthase subunit E [Thaumarchaeota archaeon]|nr:MAG: V-type ATP synthase subunit E [Nitrosopumilales archaeon]MCZ6581587.1 V-type ATP synthase subunit E [Nitrososphaerota archaeon]GFN40436.1 MAG: V-type ATP synthase subunit E [Marine Group I thaumarchaeote]